MAETHNYMFINQLCGINFPVKSILVPYTVCHKYVLLLEIVIKQEFHFCVIHVFIFKVMTKCKLEEN